MMCTLDESGKFTGTIRNYANVLPIKHIPSKENIAHFATRYKIALSSIGPRSLWQNEPKWLCKPITEWPTTRSFA